MGQGAIMSERQVTGNTDGDVSTASVEPTSISLDGQVSVCGHRDRCSCSQTQDYTTGSKIMTCARKKFSSSDLHEFKCVYDDYFFCSSDEEDSGSMDTGVLNFFAPPLPSAESPTVAIDNEKVKHCLKDILDCVDDCEKTLVRVDNVSGGSGQEFEACHTTDSSSDNQVCYVGRCANVKTNMDGKSYDSSKSQNNEFGVVRLFLTGEVIRAAPHKGGFYRASANHAPYLHKLYSFRAPTEQEICDQLFTAPPSFKYGTSYKFEPKADTWAIFWEPQKLSELTTLTITSIICAALNSRRRLHWVIGIGRDRKILGCSVTTEERDTLTQAFIYAVRSGIMPQLHPNLVEIRFISVEGQQLDENEMRLLVTITIDHRVTTLYQLISGRIFHVSKNELKEIEGGIDEARRMMQLRKSKDYISLVDQDPCGYLRYTWSEDSCRIHSVLFFLAKAVTFLVPGIVVGFITRYALSKMFR